MTTTVTHPAAAPAATDPREALNERLIGGLIAGGETLATFLGIELGLYETLAHHGPATAPEVASRTGIAVRYAREWLEQQAVSGILSADANADTDRRLYSIDPDRAEVLTDQDSPYYAAGPAMMLAGIARALPLLSQAMRTGTGVAYSEYGAEIRAGIAAFNRPAFLHELGSRWLPSVPDVHSHLSTAPGARILDLGCGVGGSSIAMAQAYPNVEVVGVDLDEQSITEARASARSAGLHDRVTFRLDDAADLPLEASFDVVTIFEALHDMGDPVGALRTARRLLTADGCVLVADERVADSFTAPGDDLERLVYVMSVLHCVPATLAERPVEVSGTALRASTVRRWASEAGFSRVEELPVDFPFWRFYRLHG